MQKLKIKVCGLTARDNTEKVLGLKPDYAGFIFYTPSPRDVTGRLQHIFPLESATTINTVAVTVDMSVDELGRLLSTGYFNTIQLHGHESPEYCMDIKQKWPKIEIIKAFSVDDAFNFNETKAYHSLSDYFLFDTRSETPGGSGRKFNWPILRRYTGSTPFFLSGGIGPELLDDIIKFSEEHALLYGIDINSSFETSPGIKDTDKLKKFFNGVRNL
ncbi:MAG: phosphoribosylanthranilate isomerase [Candidatus Dadabacteria bacterium]|nr:MAG: phosphoribosylanthranilate isomerase [Candidatus Dadabacteria bacterium]